MKTETEEVLQRILAQWTETGLVIESLKHNYSIFEIGGSFSGGKLISLLKNLHYNYEGDQLLKTLEYV